ncbi:hypothetical protein VitviT2T_029953 [Vitis vinifera]|uniref:Protein kinase domain-containing protein n=2 Tax=Vitis vinifera TaxID=29760 RepID=A0ABY9DY13_VITVI|nr:hypothetical protein VitviT2T_029953 [Vitis vinifera]
MLIWVVFSSLLVMVCEGGQLLKSQFFFNFIQAVDPENILGIGWNGSLPHPCMLQRKGVKCNSQAEAIVDIRLENLNLSGIIDADSLCKLPFLRVVSLAKNLIRGSIPESISLCTSLTYLNLSSNLLNGSVPGALTGMKNLRSLDISHNHLLGKIPDFDKHLYKFSLKSNEFLVNETRSLVTMSQGPSPKPETSEARHEKGIRIWASYAPVVICIGFFLLFAFFVNKKAVRSAKEKEILKSLGASPLKSPRTKTTDEVKPEKACSELVFFVGEHARFRLEDLLESAADLQSQSLCSSLYKVTLKNDAVYAVKRVRKLQGGFEEFGQTMRRIGNLRHPNILPLVCYNSSKEEKLLIYNYQRNGSLQTLLENYIEGKREFPWRHRLSIACGIARGLDFIHQKTDHWESIPHGGIKLSNILLNENEEPLISEYGYSKFLDPKTASLYSSNGYTAPERGLSEEGDVFSFGVILLELLTGKTVEKSALDLPKWVKSMVREEWTGEVFDKEVNRAAKQWAFPMLNISLKCVAHFPENRPSVAEVLEKIEEVVNAQGDIDASPDSSIESNYQDGCLLHTVIPETWDTPGSNS